MKPLPATVFLFSIIGFIISVYLTSSGLLDETWGFTFCLTFLVMFLSGVVSMTPSEKDLEIKITVPKSVKKKASRAKKTTKKRKE